MEPATAAFCQGAVRRLDAARWLAIGLPWMPRTASLHGPAIDSLMHTSLAALFALGVLAQVLILAGLFLRREKRPRFSNAWRWGATVIVIGLFVWMTVVAERLWSTIRLTQAQANAVQVEVIGIQFQWYFRYPGPDGTFGRTKPTLIDAPAGNPLGLDPADPHSHDDIVSSVLVLPIDRQVLLRLRAMDVIHGFYVPAMRIMQNATPGNPSEIHLTPTRTGDYAIVCSQLCGLGHYRMHAMMHVVSASQYADWMKQQETQNQSAAAGR